MKLSSFEFGEIFVRIFRGLEGRYTPFRWDLSISKVSQTFSNLVISLKSELFDFGFLHGDLGTHSCMKGVATLIARAALYAHQFFCFAFVLVGSWEE